MVAQIAKRNSKQRTYTPNDPKTGRFRKGCKPGPGTPKGTLRGMRALLERIDEAVLAAVERGDLDAACELFYKDGAGKGFIEMLRAYKQLGILDALLKEAAVPEQLDVSIVIGEDRKIESPPGVDPFPERG